jgi:hypothetical protein
VDLNVGESPNLLNGFPVCSWDAKRVLAIVDPGAGPSEIWLADLEEAQPFRRIFEAPAQVRRRGGAWLPRSPTVMLSSSIRSAEVVLFERVKPVRP